MPGHDDLLVHDNHLYDFRELARIFPMHKNNYCNTRTLKNHARLAWENLKCRLSTDARGKGSQE